jgi:hypothetical protein
MTRHLATLRLYQASNRAFPTCSQTPPACFGLRVLIKPALLRVGLACPLSRLIEPTDRFPCVTRACKDHSKQTPLGINPLLSGRLTDLLARHLSTGLPRTSWSCRVLLLLEPFVSQTKAQTSTRWHKPVVTRPHLSSPIGFLRES